MRSFFLYYIKIYHTCFYSLVITICLGFSPLVYEKYQFVKSVCFLFFAFIIFAMFISDKRKICLNTLSTAVVLFLAYRFFQILLTPYNLQFHYMYVYLTPVLFFLPLFIVPDKEKFIFFMLLSGGGAVLFAFYQVFSGVSRPFSFFGNPIFFGEFLIFCLAVSLYSFFVFNR